MNKQSFLFALLLAFALQPAAADDGKLATVLAAQPDEAKPRYQYRHPQETIEFFGIEPGMTVVDLGAAPGGWCQVAVKRVNALGDRQGKAQGTVLGVDVQPVEPIAGTRLLELDFMDEGADAAVKAALGGQADVVLSDMAAPASGHRATDHLRIIALAEAAAYFAFDVLAEGGSFAAKVLQGGTEGELLALLKTHFRKVSHIKPPASRTDSAEMFVVATGFRGDSDRTE